MNRPIIIGRRHSGQQVLDLSHCGQRRRRLERRAPARSGTAAARLRIVAGFRTSSSVSRKSAGRSTRRSFVALPAVMSTRPGTAMSRASRARAISKAASSGFGSPSHGTMLRATRGSGSRLRRRKGCRGIARAPAHWTCDSRRPSRRRRPLTEKALSGVRTPANWGLFSLPTDACNCGGAD